MIEITNAKIAVTSDRVAKIRPVDMILPEASGLRATLSEALEEAIPRPRPAPITPRMAIPHAIAISPVVIFLLLLMDGFRYINGR